MGRKFRFGNLRNTSMYCMAFSSVIGLVVIFACLLGFSAIITKIDAPELMVTVLSTAALCIGAYAGGYICARKRRQNGLLMGVICGTLIFFAILVLSLIFTKSALSFSAGGKLLLSLVFAGIGGVVGVNAKGRRLR